MSAALNGTGIDTVLRDAVNFGAVPHAAAIAAGRDGGAAAQAVRHIRRQGRGHPDGLHGPALSA
jgi:ribosomal protein L12E/L44/L45/RPP1/RPP2